MKILSAGVRGQDGDHDKLSENKSGSGALLQAHDERKDPRHMLRSLAFQLAEYVPAYRTALEKKELKRLILTNANSRRHYSVYFSRS